MVAAFALLATLSANPITDAGAFPIAVWLQSPSQAPRYKAAGFNLFVGLWKGPTEEQLAELKKAGMPVVCEQNEVGLRHRDDPIIAGWMHGDEPDNAQATTDPVTGKQGWGPCIPPARIVEEYHRIKKADPSRPVLLNLGQGVANDAWIGRGNGAKLSDYETYVQGCDVVSFDVYPVAGLGKPGQLSLVPKGVGRLTAWTGGKKPVWNCLECTAIDGKMRPTPAQVRAEAWAAIVRGSTGLIYFVHQFAPKFNEHALLDDPEMLAAVTALNGQIQAHAAALRAKPIAGVGTDNASVYASARSVKGTTYVFAISLVDEPVDVKITLADEIRASVAREEGRQLTITAGRLADRFEAYQAHIYRLGPVGDKRDR